MIELAAAAVAGGAVWWCAVSLAGRWWSLILVPLLIPGILLGAHFHRTLPHQWQRAYHGFLVAVIVMFAAEAGRIVQTNLVRPPEWDFLGFWVPARVAGRGLDFYDPARVRELASSVSSDRQFLLQVPFKYFPPTMLLLLPLSLLDPRPALGLWYLGQAALLAADIILLARLTSDHRGLLGLAVTAGLVMAFRPTQLTVFFVQMNFLLLLAVLLWWRDRDRPRAGVWLVMGMLAKPIMPLLLLYPVIRRQWRTLVVAAVTGAAVAILTMAVFGRDVFTRYVAGGGFRGVPAHLFTEPINQSLLATILRVTGSEVSSASFALPVFIVLALVLTACTAYTVHALRRSRSDVGLALTVSWALLLYPVTLRHYAVLLLPVLLLLWQRRGDLPGGVRAMVTFITAEYALVYRPSFVATLLAWLVLLGAARHGAPSR